ncbi:MAG: hypothetical protein Q9164_001024 [Protoblastenia rupestris]
MDGTDSKNNQRDTTKAGDDEAACSICQSAYDTGDEPEIPVTLPCGHEIGSVCISKWLHVPRRKNGCPLCRKKFFKSEGNMMAAGHSYQEDDHSDGSTEAFDLADFGFEWEVESDDEDDFDSEDDFEDGDDSEDERELYDDMNSGEQTFRRQPDNPEEVSIQVRDVLDIVITDTCELMRGSEILHGGHSSHQYRMARALERFDDALGYSIERHQRMGVSSTNFAALQRAVRQRRLQYNRHRFEGIELIIINAIKAAIMQTPKLTMSFDERISTVQLLPQEVTTRWIGDSDDPILANVARALPKLWSALRTVWVVKCDMPLFSMKDLNVQAMFEADVGIEGTQVSATTHEPEDRNQEHSMAENNSNPATSTLGASQINFQGYDWALVDLSDLCE